LIGIKAAALRSTSLLAWFLIAGATIDTLLATSLLGDAKKKVP
jgi:hypothetical protein